VIRSAGFMLLSTLLRIGTAAGLFVLLAREWGVASFGSFMYAYTISQIATLISDYGFGIQVVRDIAGARTRMAEIMADAMRAKTALALLAIIGTAAFLGITGASRDVWVTTILLLLGGLVSSYGLLLNLPFRGVGRFWTETRVVLQSNVALLVLIGALAVARAGPTLVSAGFLAARILYLEISARAYKDLVPGPIWPKFRLPAAMVTLRAGLPFGLFVALGTLYFHVDTVLLEHFSGDSAVGIYQAAVRILVAALIVADVLSNVYLPALQGFASGDRAGDLSMAARMVRRLTVAVVLGRVILWGGGAQIANVVYGKGYATLAQILPWFGVILALRYIASGYGLMLTIVDEQASRTGVVAFAVLVSVGLNAALVPSFAVWGAVVASVGTHVFLVLAYLLAVRRRVGTWLFDARTVGVLCIAVAFPLATVRGNAIAAVAEVALTAALVLLTGLRSEEWRALRVWKLAPAR